MKEYIDRIEDRKTAVINIKGGGQMILPLKQLGIDAAEGDHLDITVKKDEESKKKTTAKIKQLQEELLEKNKRKK